MTKNKIGLPKKQLVPRFSGCFDPVTVEEKFIFTLLTARIGFFDTGTGAERRVLKSYINMESGGRCCDFE